MDLFSIFNNHLQRDKLIAAINYSNEIQKLACIGVFVLLIGKLEDILKALVYTYAKQEYIQNIDNKTLGAVICRVKKILNEIINSPEDVSKYIKDYRIRKLFSADNVEEFIGQCEQVRDLRNDLIHNIISPKKSKECEKMETIEYLLSKLYFFIGATSTKQARLAKASQYLLDSGADKERIPHFELEHINILEADGKIRDKLTVADLIDLAHLYYRGIKDFVKNQESK